MIMPLNVDQIPNINQIFYNLSYTMSQFVVNLLFDDDAEHSKLLAYFLVLWLYNLWCSHKGQFDLEKIVQKVVSSCCGEKKHH